MPITKLCHQLKGINLTPCPDCGHLMRPSAQEFFNAQIGDQLVELCPNKYCPEDQSHWTFESVKGLSQTDMLNMPR